MQGTKGQPSPRQGSIDLQNREGQHGTGARGSAFKLTNALAKLGKHGIEGMVGHGRFVLLLQGFQPSSDREVPPQLRR